MRFKLIFALLLALPVVASAKPNFGEEITWAHIQEICRERWKNLPTEDWDGTPETKGVVKFALTSRTVATQPRIAAQKLVDSITGIPAENKRSHLEKYGATWIPIKNAYTFKEHGGKSLYSLRNALDVIAYRGKLYDIDGHHRNIVSIFVGSPETPVRIKDDWSDLPWKDFVQRMKDEKYTYVRSARETPKFSNPCDLEDDPNLYFARLLTLNVKYDEATEAIVKTDGANPYLFAKINRGRPMQEFEEADQMTDAGLLYDPHWGRVIPEAAMKRAGRLFQKAHWAENDPRVIAFSAPQNIDIPELTKLIRRRRKAACEKKLSQAK